MHMRNWSVCLIEAGKYEAQIIVDLLRNAGVEKVKVFLDSQDAMDWLQSNSANIVILALEAGPLPAVGWTKNFRRNPCVMDRKASVFLTSRAFSRAVAEECRHAGANALIGKPVSAATLLATIKKVQANPRDFIDDSDYVGPCRRAGIVTAGKGSRRRQSDEHARADAPTLADIVAALNTEIAAYAAGRSNRDRCAVALRPVHAYAVNAGDGPMLRVSAALTLMLQAQNLEADAMRGALLACAASAKQLAAEPDAACEKRDGVAERVRRVVAKAAQQKAA
jgi:DNA-binding response OmpR family regulator